MRTLDVRRAERLVWESYGECEDSRVRVSVKATGYAVVEVDNIVSLKFRDDELHTALVTLVDSFSIHPDHLRLLLTKVEGKLTATVLVPLVDLNGLSGVVLLDMARERAGSPSVVKFLDAVYCGALDMLTMDSRPNDIAMQNVAMQGMLDILIAVISHDPWQVTNN